MNVKLHDQEIHRNHVSEQCFDTLYNQYVDRVYRQCLSMTKDADQAQDLTQDIFLKVFNKLDAFQERSSFSTWLHAIVHNHCADQLRLSKRLVINPISIELENSLAESSEAHLHEETLQRMKLAMATLAEEEQRILRLKYEESRSIDEIAQLYGLTISAVKMRLKRSREKVQRLCAQQL